MNNKSNTELHNLCGNPIIFCKSAIAVTLLRAAAPFLLLSAYLPYFAGK